MSVLNVKRNNRITKSKFKREHNKMAEKNDDDDSYKFNKPLGKIFNTKKKLLRAVSLCNLKDVKMDYDKQECQHLLENTEEVRLLRKDLIIIRSIIYA